MGVWWRQHDLHHDQQHQQHLLLLLPYQRGRHVRSPHGSGDHPVPCGRPDLRPHQRRDHAAQGMEVRQVPHMAHVLLPRQHRFLRHGLCQCAGKSLGSVGLLLRRLHHCHALRRLRGKSTALPRPADGAQPKGASGADLQAFRHRDLRHRPVLPHHRSSGHQDGRRRPGQGLSVRIYYLCRIRYHWLQRDRMVCQGL